MEHGLVTIFGGVVHVGSGVLGRREALSGLPTVLFREPCARPTSVTSPLTKPWWISRASSRDLGWACKPQSTHTHTCVHTLTLLAFARHITRCSHIH